MLMKATATALVATSAPNPLELNLASAPSKRTAREKGKKESDSENEAATPEPKRKRKVAVKKQTDSVSIQIVEDDGLGRCTWAASSRYPLLQKYHDTEWCIPGGFDRTNRYLFEMIILEGAQAGLSWSTVLHKRDAYREAYDQFDYNIIADTYTSPASNDRLLQTNIVKNKLKVEASITNAKAFRNLLKELYPDQVKPEDENGFWQFLQAYRKPDGAQQRKKVDHEDEKEEGYMTRSDESDRLSADLKNRGFKFVGNYRQMPCDSYLVL
ncbi:hypothetical protein BGX28_006542 [Mortierella sp. GBA30]|nr:hypothetical protein BGX28_006542 [Mortierella sp. GBA30]